MVGNVLCSISSSVYKKLIYRWSYEVSLYNQLKGSKGDFNGVVLASTLFSGVYIIFIFRITSFISGMSRLEEYIKDYKNIILMVGTALISICLMICYSGIYTLTIFAYVGFYSIWEFLNAIFSISFY